MTKKPVKRKEPCAPHKRYPPEVVDAERKVALPVEMVRDLRIRVGEEYAVWKKGKDFVLVFPDRLRKRLRIPKHAHWGKVEP